MAMVYERQYTGDGQDTGDSKTQQSINQQGLYVLVKEAVVPKEFETSKEGGAGRSRRPAGPLLRADMANRGFSSY